MVAKSASKNLRRSGSKSVLSSKRSVTKGPSAASASRSGPTQKPPSKRGNVVTNAKAAPQKKVAAQTGRQMAAKIKKEELEALRIRDEIVVKYMPYATSIANRVSQSLSGAVDYNDILCNARLGLLEAAKKYDTTLEVDFKTFSYYRIKGAIYDGLRKTGWLPRTLYARIKFEEASNEYLKYVSETSRGYVSDDEIVGTVNNLASIYVMSLDANDDIEIEDENNVDIEQNAAFLQIRRFMREAIVTLPEKEKQLIKMYYFQNKTLEEAGERLELSKSWASRLHARALEMLLKRIRELTQGVELPEEVILEGLEELHK